MGYVFGGGGSKYINATYLTPKSTHLLRNIHEIQLENISKPHYLRKKTKVN